MTIFKYALIAAVSFALGWQSTIWTGKHIVAANIDARIAACLRQPYE